MTSVGESAEQSLPNLEEPTHCVEIHMPAQPEMWGLARMSVSTVASMLQMSIERIEDLRIAADELCTLCATGSGPDSQLQVTVRYDPTVLAVSCTATEIAGDGEAEPSDLPEGFTSTELSERILEALVDEYSVSSVKSGTRQGWFLART